MKQSLFLLLLLGIHTSVSAQDTYKKPFPHSSGADLLAYCQQTDDVISQLRCNYYVQGVADLAVQEPLACIPKGINQSELIQLAVEYLESVKAETLKKQSAASLLLVELQRKYRCPKKQAKAKPKGKSGQDVYAEAIRKQLEKQAAEENAAKNSEKKP